MMYKSQLKNKLTLMTGFVVQGHILKNIKNNKGTENYKTNKQKKKNFKWKLKIWKKWYYNSI